MSVLVAVLAAGAMHPQVIECAAAVRAQGDTSVACADPTLILTPKAGEAAQPAMTSQCASALLAGRTVGKVPASKTQAVRAAFEQKLRACEASITQGPTSVPTRQTTKLWD